MVKAPVAVGAAAHRGMQDLRVTYSVIPPQGYQRVGRIANAYVWSSTTPQEENPPITQIAVLHGQEQPEPGFVKVPESIVPNATPEKSVYLAVSRDPERSPVLAVSITAGVVPAPEGFVKLERNLTPHGAEAHYLCVQTVESQAAKRRTWQVGDLLDCLDSVNKWCPAQVVDISNGKYRIHFTGWSDKWNEWIDQDSDRLAEYRRHTVEGQPIGPEANQGAFNFSENKAKFGAVFEELKSIMPLIQSGKPEDLTPDQRKFLLGNNHGMVHDVLNAVVDDPEAITQIIRYLEMNLEVIVFWFKNPDAIPQEAISDFVHIFNSDEKEERFYMKYGCSISDRVAQKGKFAERYEPRDADRFKKCTSIYFTQIVNHFGQLGGFDILAKRFSRRQDPFEPVSAILRAVSGRGVPDHGVSDRDVPDRGANRMRKSYREGVLFPKFVKSWIKQLDLPALSEHLIWNIDDETLKNQSTESFDDYISEMTCLVDTAYPSADSAAAYQFKERLQCLAAARMLRCSKLATRLAGAKKLVNLIEQIRLRESVEPVNVRGGLAPARWLTSDYLVRFIEDKRIMDCFIAPGSHEQMISRSTRLIQFMSAKGALTSGHLNMLWSNTTDAHESSLRLIYDTVANIAAQLPPEMLRTIAAKIYEVPYKAYTKFLMDFIQKFTIGAVKTMSRSAEEEWYGLDIFWQMEQDDRPVPEALAEASHQSLVEMLRNPLFARRRLHYIETALHSILKGRSPVQCWRLVEAIVQMFDSRKSGPSGTQAEVLQAIIQNFDVVRLFMLDLRRYSDRVMMDFGSSTDPDFNPVVGGRFSHSEQIWTRLRFLNFIMASGSVELSRGHVEDLWHVFVVQPISPKDPAKFFEWLVGAVGGDHPSAVGSALADEVVEFVFSQLFCGSKRPDYATLSEDGFVCFRLFMIRTNLAKGYLIPTTSRWSGLYVTEPSLIGLDGLWRLALLNRDPKVAKLVARFLTHLHTSLDPNLTVRQSYQKMLEAIIDWLVVAVHTATTSQKVVNGEIELDPTQARQAILNLIQIVSIFLEAVRDRRNSLVYGIKQAAKRGSPTYTTVQACEDDYQFPQIFLSNHPTALDLIFRLLDLDQDVADAAWALLDQLPSNHSLATRLRLPDPVQPDWDSIFPRDNLFRLLYALQIAEATRVQVNDASAPNMIQGVQSFQQLFLDSAGPAHLADIFIGVVQRWRKQSEDNVRANLRRPLICRAVAGTLRMLRHFLAVGGVKALEGVGPKQVLAALVWILGAASYSTVPDPDPEASAAGEDAADDVSEPLLTHLADTVLSLSAEICRLKPDVLAELLELPAWEQILSRGLLNNVSDSFRARLSEGLLSFVAAGPEAISETLETRDRWIAFLLRHSRSAFTRIQTEDTRCGEFFRLFRNLILNSPQDEADVEALGAELLQRLQQHPVVEERAADSDPVLAGLFQIAGALVRVSPSFQAKHGAVLAGVVLNAVFELPKPPRSGQPKPGIQKFPPKAKSATSRRAAFGLLLDLARGNPANLRAIVQRCIQNHLISHSGGEQPDQWLFEAKNEEKSAIGYVGMRNLGCICYLNSLMQQLYMIPSLRANLLRAYEVVKDDPMKEDDVLFQLQWIMGYLQESEKMYCDPTGFCLSFKDWDGQPINVKVQKDSGGFLNELVDKVDERLKGTEHADAVKSVLGGVLSNQLIGLGDDCPHYREREEDFYSLTLPVKNKSTIEESLAAFCEGEALVGSNAFKCPDCDKKVDTLKRVCIKRLPPTVCFNLKRFELSYESLETTKLNSELHFPTRINLKPYTKEGLAADPRIANKMTEVDDEKREEFPDSHYEYVLRGVVVHTGTAGGGHYYSFVQERLPTNLESPDDGWVSGRWVELNDHLARPFDPSQIPEECFGGMETIIPSNPINAVGQRTKPFVREKSRSGYLLFYDRADLSVDPSLPPSSPSSKSNSSPSSPRQPLAPSIPPPARVPVPEDILEKIWRQNIVFFRDRAVFEVHYFEFLWKLITQAFPAQAKAVGQEEEFAQEESKASEKGGEGTVEASRMATDEALFFESIRLAVQFVMETLSRSHHQNVDDFGLVEWTEWIESALARSTEASRWFLEQMARPGEPQRASWNKLFLLRCPEASVRRNVVTLITAALRKLSEEESEIHALGTPVAEAPLDEGKEVPVWEEQRPASPQYIRTVISLLGQVSRHWQRCDDYFLTLYNFAQQGPQHVRYLLSHNLIARLIDFFLGDKSPAPHVTPNLSLDSKGQRPSLGNAYAYPELLHFLRLLQVLVCCSMTPTVPADGLPGPTPDEPKIFPTTRHIFPETLEAMSALVPLSEEAKLLLFHEAWIGAVLLMGTTRQRGLSIGRIMCHLSWENEEFSQVLVTQITQGIEDNCWDLVRPYFRVIKALTELEDSLQLRRVDWILVSLLTVMELQQRYWKITDFCIEHLVRIAKGSRVCADWIRRNARKVDWILNWIAIFHQPPHRDTEQSTRFKPRRQQQLQVSPWVLPPGSAGMRGEVKLRTLKALQQNQEVLDDDVSDSDDDLDSRSFLLGQWVDAQNPRSRRNLWQRAEVVGIRSNQVKLRFWSRAPASVAWFSMGSSKIAPLGQHTKKGKPKAEDPRDD